MLAGVSPPPHDVNVGTMEPQSASCLPEQLTDSVAAAQALAEATVAPAAHAPSAGSQGLRPPWVRQQPRSLSPFQIDFGY